MDKRQFIDELTERIYMDPCALTQAKILSGGDETLRDSYIGLGFLNALQRRNRVVEEVDITRESNIGDLISAQQGALDIWDLVFVVARSSMLKGISSEDDEAFSLVRSQFFQKAEVRREMIAAYRECNLALTLLPDVVFFQHDTRLPGDMYGPCSLRFTYYGVEGPTASSFDVLAEHFRTYAQGQDKKEYKGVIMSGGRYWTGMWIKEGNDIWRDAAYRVEYHQNCPDDLHTYRIIIRTDRCGNTQTLKSYAEKLHAGTNDPFFCLHRHTKQALESAAPPKFYLTWRNKLDERNLKPIKIMLHVE